MQWSALLTWPNSITNTAQLLIPRDVSSLRPHETFVLQKNPKQGETERDGVGERLTNLFSGSHWLSFSSVWSPLKRWHSPSAKVSIGLFQPVESFLSVDITGGGSSRWQQTGFRALGMKWAAARAALPVGKAR